MPPDVKPVATGDLTDKSVVKTFNAMQDKGAELLIAMDDSNGDLLDDRDHALFLDIDDKIPRDVLDDIARMRKALPYQVKYKQKAQALINDCMTDDGTFNVDRFYYSIRDDDRRLKADFFSMFCLDEFEKLGIKKLVITDLEIAEFN